MARKGFHYNNYTFCSIRNTIFILSVLYCTQLMALCNTSLHVQSFVFHFIEVQ